MRTLVLKGSPAAMLLLAEGAIVQASITGSPAWAGRARPAAARLLDR